MHVLIKVTYKGYASMFIRSCFLTRRVSSRARGHSPFRLSQSAPDVLELLSPSAYPSRPHQNRGLRCKYIDTEKGEPDG